MMASSRASQEPYISDRISTTSPALDLSQDSPFVINVNLTLKTPYAITFMAFLTPLFDGILYSQGLTFRNTRTHEYVPRPKRHVQTLSRACTSIPTQETNDMWTTLFPDQPHGLKATFKPEVGPPPIQMRSGMTYMEFQKSQSQQTPVRTWSHAHGFKHSERYNIAIIEDAAVKEWIQSSLEEIMHEIQAGRLEEVLVGKIHYVLESGAEFTVKFGEPKFVNQITGEVRKTDSRLMPEPVKKRGVNLQTIALI